MSNESDSLPSGSKKRKKASSTVSSVVASTLAALGAVLIAFKTVIIKTDTYAWFEIGAYVVLALAAFSTIIVILRSQSRNGGYEQSTFDQLRIADEGMRGNPNAGPDTIEKFSVGNESQLHYQMQWAIEGLTSEIDKTRSNAQVNLGIGGSASALAMLILGITLLASTKEYNKLSDFYSFMPRITLSLFIEFFSFFFLRLYKRNLDDIKYLTNEVSNIKLKLIALRASFVRDPGDQTSAILHELAKVERNFILKKDESTVEIEKIKIDADGQNKLIENIASIFKGRDQKK